MKHVNLKILAGYKIRGFLGNDGTFEPSFVGFEFASPGSRQDYSGRRRVYATTSLTYDRVYEVFGVS